MSTIAHYLGNPRLRKADTTVPMTQEQVVEWARCADDPIHFIRNHVKIVNVDRGFIPFDLWPFQEKIIKAAVDNRYVICKLPRQSGKVLRDDELIASPTGFRRMGDLRVGDQVIDERGLPCNVVHVSEQQMVPAYRITFDDGSTVVACEDHQWTVNDRLNQKITQVNGKRVAYEHREVTATTKQLAESHWKRVNAKGREEYAYYIPNTQPVQYTRRELRIDPYVLGLWLGDGSSWGTELTLHKDHKSFYESQGVIFRHDHSRDKKPNVFTQSIANLTRADLREYGLLKTEVGAPTKHIPADYQFASVDQRIALLQGLMDTDGHVTKNGHCHIQLTRKNQWLIEDVYTLLCSLGLKVTRKVFEKSNSERLSFTVGRDKFDVCRMPHKLERQKASLPNARCVYSRTIQNFERLEQPIVGRCIQVDSPRSLYLCTKSFIPTHNTTTVMSLLLWSTLFTEQYGVAVLAHKQSHAYEILARYKEAYEALPMWLQQGVKEWNKGSVELENGSSVLASATSSSAVRGGSYSLVYLDELAFVPRNLQREFFASVYPTISSGATSKILITSTPNGLDMFHSIWAKAVLGRNNYTPIEIAWNDVPGRDEAWKKQIIADTSEAQFRVEFEARFEGSSNSLITGHVIEKLVADDPIEQSNELKVYEQPVEGATYGMFVDVGQGIGSDYSVVQVFDVTRLPFRQVAMYRSNNISPLLLPEVIFRLSHRYREPIVVVERNDQGSRVADSLYYDYDMENVMQTIANGRAGQVLAISDAAGRFGVQMSKAIKKIGCSLFKTLLENDQILVRDEDTIREISTFVRKGDSFAAEDTSHDDTVMPLVMLAWCSGQSAFKDMTSTDARARMLQLQSTSIEQSMMPVGLNMDDMEEEFNRVASTADMPDPFAIQWYHHGRWPS